MCKMLFLSCTFLLIYCSEISQSANILAIFPLHGKSHFMVYQSLLKGLAQKGHYVDVLSHFSQEEIIDRYNDLSLKGVLPSLTNNLPYGVVGNTFFEDLHFIIKVGGVDLCKVVFNTSLAHELKRTKKKYDVMITEIFATDCMLGYSHIFNIPTIGMTSSVSLPWASDRFGIPDNPSYIPNYFASYSARMTLKERVINTLLTVCSKIGYNIFSISQSNFYAKSFFGQDLPDLYDLVNNMSLLFVNSHFSLNQARPFPPNVVEIGGIHIGQNKSLPQYLEEALKTDLKGIIYLSFGSMMRTETFPEKQLRGLFEAFSQLPYKVLWKGVRDDIPKNLAIPDNIQFQPWMPQLDILCHPKVKLFVSHGGLLGTQEAIHCGVPILGIPIFADQIQNIKTIVAQSIALEVSFDSMSKELVFQAAHELLENPVYQANVQRLSRRFRDRPMSPLDTAVYWVEYIIRHNGAPHLRSAGADLPWHQYYLVDVAGVLLVCLLLIFAGFYYAVLLIYFLLKLNKTKLKSN